MILFILLLVAMQTATAKDPHGGQFTEGAGRVCASCHAKTPRTEDMYRAGTRMEKMTTDLSKGARWKP